MTYDEMLKIGKVNKSFVTTFISNMKWVNNGDPLKDFMTDCDVHKALSALADIFKAAQKADKETAQRAVMNLRFKDRTSTPATADFDLPEPNDTI